MTGLGSIIFLIACGVTVAGVVSSLAAIRLGGPVRFAEPHVEAGRLTASLLLSALAGPIMIVNEARAEARRRAPLVLLALLFVVWSLSLGTLVLALAQFLAGLPLPTR